MEEVGPALAYPVLPFRLVGWFRAVVCKDPTDSQLDAVWIQRAPLRECPRIRTSKLLCHPSHLILAGWFPRSMCAVSALRFRLCPRSSRSPKPNVKSEIDTAFYPAGVKVSDSEMATINITPHGFHGEWNYTIRPNPE